MKLVRLTIVLLAVLAAQPALAVQPDEILADPVLEARARDLSKELRCMVCQNQSIDDSDAPLARDLRLLVRERLTAGDSDRQVLDFLVARYGEFVLLRPPFNRHTALLWLLGPLVLLAAGFGLFRLMRRPVASPGGVGATPAAAPLTDAEVRRLRELLAEEPPQSPAARR
ncbi:MAG: cytochrome c-type biogenesis protein CcmH [Rhizobiales bacterium]|nr:cytochrome c-type biogenesis protein CcmH [Hyphomicrobiales bacterium]